MDTAKIIRILNDEDVIINLGSNDINQGDKVRVFSILEESIIDLDGNDLGVLDYTKAILTVKSVSENYSICHKLVKTQTNILSGLLSPFTNEYNVVSLKVDSNDIDPIKGYDQIDSTIRIGDYVKKIIWHVSNYIVWFMGT